MYNNLSERGKRIARICYAAKLDFLHEALIDYPASINWTEEDSQIVIEELKLRSVIAE